ncbi:MAG: hypothetical protein OXC95_04150 [Dehalococcoidia bacterium]|nr:hypothetical protein [Dehalococcoidia bacterium]
MPLPRLDIDTGEMTDFGQIEPLEDFVLGSLLVRRPDLVLELDTPAGLAMWNGGCGDLTGVGAGWPKIKF